MAVMAGLLCAVAGYRRAGELTASAKRLRRWVEVLRHLALLLSEGVCSLPEALEAVATASEAPDELLRALAGELRRQPLLSLAEAYAARAVPRPEGDALARLMPRLDRGSLESRRQAVEQAADELALLAASARESADRDAKMWRTLGLAGGACLTLMLL